MREKVIDAAKRYLDAKGVFYGTVLRCEQNTVSPKPLKVRKSWVVEFECGNPEGVRIDPNSFFLLVNSETFEVSDFPMF